MSLSIRSPYYEIWKGFKEKKYTLCLTNEIVEEYEEKLCEKMGPSIAGNVINAILTRSNVLLFHPSFHFQLIEQDLDDNKFVDCAIYANARCIVSNDRHFRVLQQIDFPKVEVIDIDAFLKLLTESSI